MFAQVILVVASILSLVTSTDAAPIHTSGVSPLGIFDSQCSGQPSTYTVEDYVDGSGRVVDLRCGTSSYGYKHIDEGRADGFNDQINNAIINTLEYGTQNPQGTAIKYDYAGFIVIFETSHYSDGAPKGIITAYSLARKA
ncbi:hypothetical protein FOE78_19110 [Microlunatus elymi]|uniref:Peptidase inhibitor family I36 n=1 Tax=Microlunatus elymi TaxID=2596828 RepID=A0A516Q2V2_9ACTN|nr:hypothetical protein [Microlunatus elymi]QDP97738.1 hypothetical protein FOE78_19110 [Microlunatus elymi]